MCTVEFKKLTAADTIISKYTENNTEGLIKLDQPETEQTPALTEYRYSGKDDVVKNYVEFNNETWRIIGVFNNKLKLIKNEHIPVVLEDNGLTLGGYATYMTTTEEFFYWNYGGTNNWEEANLKKYLNGTFYENIRDDSKKLIDEEKWFLGGIGITSPQTAREYYEVERSNNVYSTNPKNTVAHIGLIYPSDIYYACNPLPTSFPDMLVPGYRSWIPGSMWTIMPSSKSSNEAYNILYELEANPVNKTNSYYVKYANPDIYPTIYLKEEVKITGGDGTSSNVYQLSL